MQELIQALAPTGADAGARAIVIEGAGPAFSAGHDLGEMVGREPGFYQELFDVCTVMMETIHRLPQPVIAKVHGIATAAGCQLVAACDLAVAAEGTRFATPGVKIGLFCSTPMVPVSRAVGRKRALEMLLTGEPIDAQTALEWGLVNRVVPAEQLDEAVAELVAAIARSSAMTIAIGKRAFYDQIDLDEARRLRPDEGRDGDELADGGRAGGHERLPGEARADLVERLAAAQSRVFQVELAKHLALDVVADLTRESQLDHRGPFCGQQLPAEVRGRPDRLLGLAVLLAFTARAVLRDSQSRCP